MQKVLVVDDENSIATLLKYNLQKAGYEVITSKDGKQAFDLALKNNFDFILLDLMLPSMDGMDVTRRLRQEKIETPIIIITARDEEYDKIIGLELGADDYLTKPFSPREVVARLKAISRRIQQESKKEEIQKNEDENEQYSFETFSVNLINYRVMKNGKKVKLTPKEFELLEYFVKRPGHVLSREKLLNGVWGFDYIGQTRMVDMHISHLREKIEDDPKNPSIIVTVRGFGYRFEGVRIEN